MANAQHESISDGTPTRTGNTKVVSALLVLAGATCWGVTGLANRMLTPCGFSQMQLVFIRVSIATVALLVFLLARDRNLLRIRLRDLWCFIGTGILSLALFAYSYFTAMQELSLSAAAVLLYTAPVFVTLMSAAIFRERLNVKKLVALVMVFSGAALMCGLIGAADAGGAGAAGASAGGVMGEGGLRLRGLGFGLLSGFAYALYSIFSRFALNRGYRPLTIAFYTVVFATVASGVLSNPADVVARTAEAVTADGPGIIFWELFMGLVTCAAAYAFYTSGLAGLENGPASIIATWELVVATLVSIFVFVEPFSLVNLIGLLLVLAGIAIMNVPGKRTSE